MIHVRSYIRKKRTEGEGGSNKVIEIDDNIVQEETHESDEDDVEIINRSPQFSNAYSKLPIRLPRTGAQKLNLRAPKLQA